MMQARWAAACGVVAVLAWSSVASANVFELFGAGARSSAMAGAGSATVEDFTAVHANMGALAFQETNMGVGLLMAVDDAQIRLKPRPPGYDIPNLGRNSPAIPSDFRLRPRADTQDLEDTYGIYMGGVSSFGFERLRIGGMIYLPVNRIGLQQTHFPDEREQYFSNQLHFELLGGRVQHQIIMVGGAYQLTDWLAVGAGISFLPKAAGVNQVYLDNPTDQSRADLTIQNDQTGRVAPQVGVLMAPSDKLKLGVAWRGEIFFTLDSVNEIQIRGFQEVEDEFPIRQAFKVVQNYTPHRVVVGLDYAEEDRYRVAIDVTYALWSQYLTHQGETTDQLQDTFSLRAGLEYRYSPLMLVRAGLGFDPSPVQEQTGRTNYVDNDRAVVSLGMGHPMQFLGQDVEFSWFMQLQTLVPRDTNKDFADAFPNCGPNVKALCDEVPDDARDPVTGELVPENQGLQSGNPGFPGFQSFGQLLSVGADLRWRF